VKGAALKRKVAALVNELAEEENFDPDELLKEVGLDSIPILSKT
jgi:aryl carrier-like protein